ncbi:MAG: hypothetical protein HYR73_02780 [Candidatus Eisenbacteria bacterium]|nr:hypothetical protein [Candidatus Eisenbacteria bacterium]
MRKSIILVLILSAFALFVGCSKSPTKPTTSQPSGGASNAILAPLVPSRIGPGGEHGSHGSGRIAPVTAPSMLPDDPFIPQGGTAYDVPVGGYSWIAVLNWARTQMPAVQTAMDEFARRGYVHNADRDTAIVFDNPPVSFVQLNYTRPGLVLPPNHFGWPVIWVKTSGDASSQAVSTQITAGIVVVDAEHMKVFSGDSLSDIAAQDPSFDVDQVQVGVTKLPVKRFSSDLPTGRTLLYKWLGCMSGAGIACMYNAFTYTWVAGVLTIGLAAPAAFIGGYSACMVVGAIICLINPNL